MPLSQPMAAATSTTWNWMSVDWWCEMPRFRSSAMAMASGMQVRAAAFSTPAPPYDITLHTQYARLST